MSEAPSEAAKTIEGSEESSIAHAVLAALAYSDVFSWPLNAEEIRRTLPVTATSAQVAQALATDQVRQATLEINGWYALAGRDDIMADRHRREANSAALWPHALRLGVALATVPFVRMVAVSGSLAMNAAENDADVDVLIVTDDRRLWTARLLTIAVGRAAALRRPGSAALCPNYLVSERNLVLSDRDVFTAHELVQLVPLSGHAVYRQLLACNQWYRTFLPNVPSPDLDQAPTARRRLSSRVVEPVLGSRLFDSVERWERDRKITKLSTNCQSTEARFDAQECKGHVDGHRLRILSAYADRLKAMGIAP